MSENAPATDVREPRAKRSRLSLWLVRLIVAEAVLWVAYTVLIAQVAIFVALAMRL